MGVDRDRSPTGVARLEVIPPLVGVDRLLCEERMNFASASPSHGGGPSSALMPPSRQQVFPLRGGGPELLGHESLEIVLFPLCGGGPCRATRRFSSGVGIPPLVGVGR